MAALPLFLSSETLRDVARGCRKLAETVHPDVRGKMLELARGYERLAAQVADIEYSDRVRERYH